MDPAYLSDSMPVRGPRRRVGLVLAAVVLALMTAFWLLCGFVTIFGAVFIRPPQAAQYPAIWGVQAGVGIVVLLLSGLCAWVVVGLFRLKNWARVGVVVVGAVVAFYSLATGAIFCVMAFVNLDAFMPPGAPKVSPALMRGVFIAMGAVSFLFALVGVWWLVYFNLRRVRALFAASGANPVPDRVVPAPAAAGGVWVDRAAPKRSVVEILLIVLAVLYFWGAAVGVISAFLRTPFFMFGHVLRGASAAVLMLALAVFKLWLGIGLLRRVKAAWIGALALNSWILLYGVTMISPGIRASMLNYQDEIARNSHFGLPPNPPLNHLLAGPIYVFSAVICVLMAGAIFWLLLRAKPLFEARAN